MNNKVKTLLEKVLRNLKEADADDVVKRELKKMGKKSVEDLTPAEKKKLFNTVDREVKAKNEDATIDEAKAKKPKLSNRIQGKGWSIVPSIDRDRFPDREREGLEGPFRHRPSGRIFYYDKKAGKYYDPTTDMYDDSVISMTEMEELTEFAWLDADMTATFNRGVLTIKSPDFELDIYSDDPSFKKLHGKSFKGDFRTKG